MMSKMLEAFIELENIIFFMLDAVPRNFLEQLSTVGLIGRT